jgi:hypothetical protein
MSIEFVLQNLWLKLIFRSLNGKTHEVAHKPHVVQPLLEQGNVFFARYSKV